MHVCCFDLQNDSEYYFYVSPLIAPGYEVSDDQLQEYRQRLQLTADTIDHYNGTEPHYHQIMDILNELEVWMATVLGIPGTHVTADLEQALLAATQPEAQPPLTINRLLDRFSETYRRLLQGPHLPAGVLHIQTGQVLIPPESRSLPQGDGGGEWRPPQFERRLQHLLEELHQRLHIFLDDVIVHDGPVRPRMMRRSGYRLVEIPRLGWRDIRTSVGWKEFVVSDQIGEALRVSQNSLGMHAYGQGKTLLDQTPGVNAVPRTYIDQPTWTNLVMGRLSHNIDTSQSLPKINVRLLQLFREEMRAQYTAQQWLELSGTDGVAVLGQSLAEVVQTISGEAYQDTPESRIQWAARIFGMSDPHVMRAWDHLRLHDVPALDEVTLDWRAGLLQMFPTSADWMAMMEHPLQREITQHILYAYGFDMGTVNERDTMLGIGMRLYGHQDPMLHATMAGLYSGHEFAVYHNHQARTRATLLYNNRRSCVSESTQALVQRFQSVQQLRTQHLSSIRVMRSIARDISALSEVAQDAIAYTTHGYSGDTRVLQGQASHIVGYNEEFILRWASHEIQGRCNSLQEAATIAQQRLPELAQLMQQVEQLEVEMLTQMASVHSDQPLTAYSPLIMRPELQLTPREEILFQLLLNEGEAQYVEDITFVQILDPQSNSAEGSIDVLATTLNRKLERNGLGTIQGGPHIGYCFRRTVPQP